MAGQLSNGPSPVRLLSMIAMAFLIGVGAAVTAAPLPLRATTTFVVNRIGNASDNNLADAKCDTSPNTGKQCRCGRPTAPATSATEVSGSSSSRPATTTRSGARPAEPQRDLQ